mgnify:CR=1 FL=1
MLALAFVVFLSSVNLSFASDIQPWPGPDWMRAKDLSYLGDFEKNLSGAHWDSELQTLYLVINKPATIWAYKRLSNEFKLVKKIRAKGDYEGITKVGSLANDVFVMGEKCACIIRYDLKSGKKLRVYKLRKFMPNDGGAGPEGLAFIPNRFLDKSIGHGQGTFGGLFVVGHQEGGDLFFFDLASDSKKIRFVRQVPTRADESSGLEFEASQGRLYIWHNTGPNSIEIVEPTLVAGGRLKLVRHIEGPKGGNVEGIAVGSVASGEKYLFFTDDDNQDGVALFWYENTAI